MSKLTEKISYLQGLAEGLKLNPDKDSHKLILGILDVLGEVGVAFDALAENQAELSEYVDSIDQDLTEVESLLYDDEEEDLAEDMEDEDDIDLISYECPHCGAMVEIDPAALSFDPEARCPECGGELFPELPEDEEETAAEVVTDAEALLDAAALAEMELLDGAEDEE